MSTTLQMIFSNEMGRNSTISLADPEEQLSSEEIEAVMDSIVAKDIFNTAGGDIVGKVRAQIVTRTVDTVAQF